MYIASRDTFDQTTLWSDWLGLLWSGIIVTRHHRLMGTS